MQSSFIEFFSKKQFSYCKKCEKFEDNTTNISLILTITIFNLERECQFPGIYLIVTFTLILIIKNVLTPRAIKVQFLLETL